MSESTWFVGILKGFGRRCWQEKDGKISRITEFGLTPDGRAVLSRDLCVGMMDGEQEFEASDLIIVKRKPRPELKADLDRMYGKIIVANGKLPSLPQEDHGPRLLT